MKKTADLTQGNIYKGILRFAVPLFLSGLLTLLYNLADTVIVGHLLGNEALAGVGSTGTIMFLMNGFMMGFTVGSSVITSRFFGAQDSEGVKRSVAMSCYLSFGIAALLTAVLLPTMPWILRLINTDEAFYSEAYRYIIVIAAGIPVMTLYKLLESLLRSIGISKMSLIFSVISFLSNIGLDILFISVFDMNTEGAAIATILSFGICAALCFWYIAKKTPILHIQKKHLRPSGDILVSQLKMALPMSLQQTVKGLGSTFIQASFNTLGTVAVAAFTVGSKVEHITTDAYTALGSTMATFCGQNYGAGKKQRIKDGINASLVIAAVYTVLSGGALLVAGRYITPLFVSENVAEVSALVVRFLYCVCPFFICLGILVILRYSIQGLGYSFTALGAALLELVLRFAVTWLDGAQKSFVVSSLSFSVSWAATAVFLILIYIFRVRKKL